MVRAGTNKRKHKEKKQTKVETVDITLINLNEEIYPRAEIDPKLVETYRHNMDAGEKFASLVVQKDTHTLLDGLHRLEALKQLGKKKVKVEILDNPDTELRTEAIRRNIKHGKRLTSREISRSIIALRFGDKKKLKDIAEIVGLTEGRVSQICAEFQLPRLDLPELSNFNSKDTKVDSRVKVDEEKKEEILKDLYAGMSGKEIAEKHNISQARVSQIKKNYEEWGSCPVYIKLQPSRAKLLFRIALANRLLKKVRLVFKKEGVFIFNSNREAPPYVVAVFPDTFFYKYKVNEPIEGYADPDMITQLTNLPDVREEFVKLALVNPQTWKISYGGLEKTMRYEKLEWRDFDFPFADVKLDVEAIPTSAHVKVKLWPHEQLGVQKKGVLTLEMRKGKLIGSYKSQKWECRQNLDLKFVEKEAEARAIVDLKTLNEILKVLSGDLWFGMWSDRANLAISQRTKEGTVMCFII